MSKIDLLSQVFSKGNKVVILCNEDDRKEIFDELKTEDENSHFGVFNNQNKLKASSIFKDGKTYHFISEEHLDKLITELEKIEIE